MNEIIEVKKGCLGLLKEAMQKKIITHRQIIDVLPHELWLDKTGALLKTILQLKAALQKKGVITIPEEARPVKKPSEFSILDNLLFQNLPEAEANKIKNIFNSPAGKKRGSVIDDENELIFIANGIISLDMVNEEGMEGIIFLFRGGEFFKIFEGKIFEGMYATVQSEAAYIWHLKEDDLKKFSPLVNTCIKIVLKNQNDCLKRILMFTKRKAKEKIKLLCDYLDAKFPDEHFPIESHMKFATSAGLVRETVTRKSKK